MKILALDLALCTGWALWDAGRLESGEMQFADKARERGMAFLRFTTWLDEMVAGPPPVDLVVYEYPIMGHRGGAAAEYAYGFGTRVQEAAARLKLACAGYAPTTVKKSVAGRGNADKGEVVAAVLTWLHDGGRDVRRRPDGKVLGTDEADAIALLMHTLKEEKVT